MKSSVNYHRIVLGLTSAFCILLMAMFSKWLLSESINLFFLAALPLIDAAYEFHAQRSRLGKTKTLLLWVIAQILTTGGVVWSSEILG